MARFWTNYWKNRYWRDEDNKEYEPIRHSAANTFRRSGVSPGDVIHILSMADGQLFLGGRMTVKQIASKSEAVEILGTDDIYEADEHAIGEESDGTPLNLHRRLASTVSRQLKFVSPTSDPKELRFVPNTDDLDGQTTRGIRELTPESAAVLDRIIEVTDQLPRSDHLITVSEELIRNGKAQEDVGEIRLPEEIPEGASYSEGCVQQIFVNRYERDPLARAACIARFGTVCTVCGHDLVSRYGEAIAGFIHIHHLKPLASVEMSYQVDPERDLRPVCPNCHAVIHRREPPYSIKEVQEFMRDASRGTDPSGEQHSD